MTEPTNEALIAMQQLSKIVASAIKATANDHPEIVAVLPFAVSIAKRCATNIEEALRTRLANLTERVDKAEAHVLTLEMQAEDRKHRNASLENQLDIVSDALEEADDEVELVQDLICAPMEKKHARAKALRDYIQGVRERAEATEAELARTREALLAALAKKEPAHE